MRELRPLDSQILLELMKNARISDRKLAKALGVSQATVSRRRAFLEQDLIDGYTTIPKWSKLGYQILAVTLVKSPLKRASDQERRGAGDRARTWLAKQHNVVMGSECRGMGMTGVMISFHKSYNDLDDFLNAHRRELGELLEDVQTIVVNLAGKAVYRPLHFKYLAQAET